MSSINEMLNESANCDDLLLCLYDLKELDVDIFEILVEEKTPMTVDEIAERIDRDRGHTFRSLQRLVHCEFVQKEQVNHESGGYHHVYFIINPNEKASQMQKKLNSMYRNVDKKIEEFRNKYS
ncbi:helix-turn-helix domain-containing protein [Halorubrum ejinorense]|uniref:Helix-turn-helix domain-containing protein n=1 Tax=Halorubrum ejinorense TaxID=425309 RepID=A0ABV4IJA6_9EURY